jgi:hypothetical protein
VQAHAVGDAGVLEVEGDQIAAASPPTAWIARWNVVTLAAGETTDGRA